MKILLFSVSALMSTIMFAEVTVKQDTKKSVSTVQMKDGRKINAKEAIAQYAMKKFGGMIRQPNSEKGRIVFVNAQKTVGKDALEKVVESWHKRYRYTMEISDKDVKSSSDTLVVRLEDLDRAEGIILAPENFWVSVNVKALAADNPPTVTLIDRFEKEVKRAFAFVCGGTCGNDPGGLCGIVTQPSDLDSIASKRYSPDIDVRIGNNLNDIGVKPYRLCKYQTAVQEGWAPQPTNDYQKAVWNEVHSVPSNPMKIEFDPKQGK